MVAAAHGTAAAGAEFGQKTREAAQRLGLKEAIANEYAQEAMAEAMFLYKSRAQDSAAQALKISQSPNVTLNSALALALNGDDQKRASWRTTLPTSAPTILWRSLSSYPW